MKKCWMVLFICSQLACAKDENLTTNTPSHLLVWEQVFGASDTIRDLSQSTNSIWAATQNNGLMRVEKDNFQLDYLNQTNSDLPNFTTCILVDSEGNVWAGTEHDGLFKLDGGLTTHITRFDSSNSMLLSHAITCLFQDEAKNIWVGSKNGLYMYSNGSLTAHSDPRFKGLHIKQVGIHNNAIYLGTNQSGLFVHSDGSWKQYIHGNSDLADNQIRRFYFENDTVIWLSSYEKYYRISKSDWIAFDEENNGISSRFVNDMMKHSTSQMMFATHKGLSILVEGRWTNYYSANSPLPHNIVERLLEDQFGGIWVGTFGGLALVHF